jgi:hypothetical protein
MGLVRLYRPFLFGSVIGGASLLVGTLLQPSSPELAALTACALGAALYVVAIRTTGIGLTIQDRDALVGAMAKPIQPHLSRLLGAVTTPRVA